MVLSLKNILKGERMKKYLNSSLEDGVFKLRLTLTSKRYKTIGLYIYIYIYI